jgi:hypothetical protein
MKTIITIFSALILGLALHAQTPQAFKYQAVVRNAEGKLIEDLPVGIQIQIIQGTEPGTVVYTETHIDTTNSFGLINLSVGEGAVQSGTFSEINWGNDIYFICISIDDTGEANYTHLGTTQLLSVPYAIQSKHSENYDESDPVFISHDAYGILSPDISNWNTAFGWGDHSAAGYLTSELWSQNGNKIYYNSGNVGIGYADPISKLQVDGHIYLDGNIVTGGHSIELGVLGSGDRNSYLDLTGDDTYTDYGLRVIRSVDGTSTIAHRGLLEFNFGCQDWAPLILRTNNQPRMTIDPQGRFGIGTGRKNALPSRWQRSARTPHRQPPNERSYVRNSPMHT